MSEVKLDFSALERLNLPAINMNPGDQEMLGEEQIEEAAEAALEEVESIEDFSKGSKPADNSSEEDNTEEDLESQDEPEVSIIKAVSEYSRAKGLFDYKDEEFEDSEEFLENKLVEKSKSYSEEWKNSLPPVVKELIDNYQDGIPLDELIYSKSREIEYNSINDKDVENKEDLQKKLIADWLYNQNYTEDEISTKIKKYEDALILEDEAKMALKKLRVYEGQYQEQLKVQVAEQKLKDQKAFEDRVKAIEKDIMGSEELIPGYKLSKEERKKVFESYTKVDSRGQTELTKAITADPLAWAKITQLMVLFKGDLSKIEKNLNSKVTKDLKTSVNTYTDTPGLNSLTSKGALSAMKKAVKLSKKN